MPPPNPDQAPFIDSFPAGTLTHGSGNGRRLTQVIAMAALAFPWVMPFAGNPSPAVWPWLSAAFCTGVLLAIFAVVGPLALTAGSVRAGWVLAASISAVIGAVQYFGFSDQFVPWLNQTRPGEAFGNLRQRNQFASLMGIGLAALIWQQRNAFGKYVPLLIILMASGNAASGSRTGALQWFAIVIIALACHGRSQRGTTFTALFALGAYLLLALTLPWLLLTLTGTISGGLVARFEEAPGCASRLVLWSNVLTLIAEKPWFGWGWGELDYAHYMTLYPGERFCEILDNAHNLPLHLAVELGVPFAAAVCGVLSWRVWRARPWRETAPSRLMAWAVLALIGLHSLLEYPLWYGPFQMVFVLCIYLLWTTRTRSGSGIAQQRGRLARLGGHGVAVGAAITMIAVAYAGWDYHRVRQIYLTPAHRDPAYRENTLKKISATHLFRHQAEFAALSLTPLTPANALEIYALSSELLHFSPEPRVIEKVIESAVMLRRDEEALLHLARYRAAFPKNHAQWRQTLVMPKGPAP